MYKTIKRVKFNYISASLMASSNFMSMDTLSIVTSSTARHSGRIVSANHESANHQRIKKSSSSGFSPNGNLQNGVFPNCNSLKLPPSLMSRGYHSCHGNNVVNQGCHGNVVKQGTVFVGPPSFMIDQVFNLF